MTKDNILSQTFRRSLLVAIPVATVVGLSALAYAGFMPFSQGQQLSSTAMNNNFLALQSQITALQTAVGVGADGGTPTLAAVPPGTIIAYGGPITASHPVPNGWLACDGSQVSRATYANLLDAIGVGYGTGDQVTTFNLPDLRGYFLRGLDTTAGASNDPNVGSRTAQNAGGNAGAEVGTYEADGIGSHTHGVNDPGHSHTVNPAASIGGDWSFGGNNWAVAINGGAANLGTTASGTGISIQSAGGSETRPKNVAVNYIIKY